MAGRLAVRPDFLLNAGWHAGPRSRDTGFVTQAQLLIVEDDSGLRDVLVRAMRAEGLGARGVACGADALVYVGEHGTPDALIIDIGLPDADGRDGVPGAPRAAV